MFSSGSSNNKMNQKRSVKFVVSPGSGCRMALNLSLCLCLALVLTLGSISKWPVLVECQEQVTVESRQQKDAEELNDTIKYLEKLDKYFSQIARPRFGRSQYKQPAGTMDRHQQQDPTLTIANNGQLFAANSHPRESQQARLGNLIDFINNRLARRYSEINF